MKSVETIPIQSWMNAPQTNAVMSALNANAKINPDTTASNSNPKGEASVGQGHECNALFVGGCVRNAMLGVEVSDIDIATKLTPDRVQEILSDAGIKTVPTGIEHGTVTAVIGGKSFEITTLRKDVETDGRRAVVSFCDNWAQDAARRDFTMNTLLADQEGFIYDPLGNGVEDLKARKVMFVGDPDGRIAEDYLRILRFFRFHAFYGQGAPDKAGLRACRAAADKISTLSIERITQEFLKILSLDDPVHIIELMFDHNILKNVQFPEYDPAFMAHFCTFQNRYGLRSIASRLFALAGLNMSHVETLRGSLLLPKVFIKDIEAISKVLALPDLDNDQAVKVAVYKFGRVPTAQALMIELAQDRVMNGYARVALDVIQNWDVPTCPVNGGDLIKEGITPGPALGDELARREQEWIDGGFGA